MKRDKRSEHGQGLVELALAMVVLMVLVSGIVDLGRIFFSYVALRDAAQEGAAYASINPTDTAGITNRVRTSSNNPVNLGDTEHVQVSVTPVGGTCAGNSIKVTVTYNEYPLITPFMGAFLGKQTLTLSAEGTDTILQSDC